MAIASQTLLTDNAADTEVFDQVRGDGDEAVLTGGDDTEDVTTIGPIGIINTAFLLNGTDDYVDLYTNPGSGAVNVVQDRTFAFTCWFKTSYTGSTKKYIMGESEAAGDDRHAAIYISNGVLSFAIKQPSLVTVTGSILVADGRWHFAVGTANSATNPMILYVDDKVDATGTVPGGPAGVMVTTSVGQLVNFGGAETGGFWQGKLADIRFYDANLTAAEVQLVRREMLGLADASQNSIYVARAAYKRNSIYRDNGSPIA